MRNRIDHDRPSFRDIIAERYSRRAFLASAVAGLGAASAPGFVGSLFSGQALAKAAASSLGFSELKRVYDEREHVAPGYRADVVVAWGDPLSAGAAAFEPAKLDGNDQKQRFGYNCDYIAFMPLPRGSTTSDHGLLCVNNEYVSPHVMFEGLTEKDAGKTMSREQVAVCNAARPFHRRGSQGRRQMVHGAGQPL
jgi:secreted PhoX family phosphatase